VVYRQGGGAEVALPAGSDSVESRLRDIQSITDAELSRLSDDDFLTELARRECFVTVRRCEFLES
jgi:hypothetical protein